MPINWCHSQGPSPKAYANWSIFFSLLQWNESAIAAWPILPYVFCHLCGQPGLASLVTSFRLTFNEWILQYFFFCVSCDARVVWVVLDYVVIIYIFFFAFFFSPRKTRREKISGFMSSAVRLKRHRQQFARWTSAKPTCTLMDIASGARTHHKPIRWDDNKFPACR